MGLWLGLAAAAAYAVPALAAASLQASSARAALWLAWVLHGSALAWAMLEPTPRFGFASALSVTAWLVLTVYAIERQLFPQLQARWALAALGSVAVLLALVFPGSALPLSATAWLPLHLALGISAYGLLAAAVVHAALMTRAGECAGAVAKEFGFDQVLGDGGAVDGHQRAMAPG